MKAIKRRKGKLRSKERAKVAGVVVPEKRAGHDQKVRLSKKVAVSASVIEMVQQLRAQRLRAGARDFSGFGEKEACELLNSGRMTHPWKKDFGKNQEPHEDWDLINSEGVKIEVKSTIRLDTFRATSVKLNAPGQAAQIILKVLLGEHDEIRDYKFVRKLGTQWVNITDEVCGRVSSSRTSTR